ncbi:hypothetical protein DRP43_05615 [candidate division TA06 bacterium]|uniref:Secretion system C-terminal sorting domain-containing protein n=1 Tax=candidate division TA06 bacterium TaxID=2250710 RepID=A0A660SC97_UNCT6|nr:MAG: hypothetical protein DRP43_05615 [candidate division TA06 bacterium]
MKLFVTLLTALFIFSAISAAEIAPDEQIADIQQNEQYQISNSVEDLNDMRIAHAVGVENNSFYHSLEILDNEERMNAMIEIMFMTSVSDDIKELAKNIEQKWNVGLFEEALMLLANLNNSEGVKGNACVGISWRNPILAPVSRWGEDVQISARDSVYVLAMDCKISNGNVFALLGFTGDGAGSKYSMNVSTDGGVTWAETYVLGGFTYEMNDLDACVSGDHFWVIYTGGGTTSQNQTMWIKRFKISDGTADTMPNGSSVYGIFTDTDVLKDVAISSNEDNLHNRVYVHAIINDGTIRKFWGYTDEVNWTEVTMSISDALQGLDATWNTSSPTSKYYIISYINNSDSVKICNGSNGDVLYSYSIGNTISAYTTSVGAWRDTVLCAFNYYGTVSRTRYLVQYGDGGSWYIGDIGPDDTESYAPDVAMRGGYGTHAVYRGSSLHGFYRYRGYSGVWTSPYDFTDHSMTGYIRPATEHLGSGNYGILYRTPMSSTGICYFDRSDWTGIKTIKDKEISTYMNIENIASDRLNVNFVISRAGNVEMKLYNITGSIAKTAFKGYRNSGEHNINIDVSKLTSGVYFVTLNTVEGTFSKKLTIVK